MTAARIKNNPEIVKCAKGNTYCISFCFICQPLDRERRLGSSQSYILSRTAGSHFTVLVAVKTELNQVKRDDVLAGSKGDLANTKTNY